VATPKKNQNLPKSRRKTCSGCLYLFLFYRGPLSVEGAGWVSVLMRTSRAGAGAADSLEGVPRVWAGAGLRAQGRPNVVGRYGGPLY
jgi:hypothetical protein